MGKLSRDLSAGILHPRENLFVTGNLGAANAEVVTPCDGSGTVALDLRGTFSMTVEVSGTVDGTNWLLIPMLPKLGGAYLAAVVGTAAGIWIGDCSGYKQVRARCTAYTSGTAIATLLATSSPWAPALQGLVTTGFGTNTGAAAAAVTLTLAAPGAGLRHYLTYLRIQKFATALLTAAATPVIVTTTNLPGSMAFSLPADAAPQGSTYSYQEDFAYPIAASAQNTATTIVAPATTAIIWRVSAGFYLNP